MISYVTCPFWKLGAWDWADEILRRPMSFQGFLGTLMTSISCRLQASETTITISWLAHADTESTLGAYTSFLGWRLLISSPTIIFTIYRQKYSIGVLSFLISLIGSHLVIACCSIIPRPKQTHAISIHGWWDPLIGPAPEVFSRTNIIFFNTQIHATHIIRLRKYRIMGHISSKDHETMSHTT